MAHRQHSAELWDSVASTYDDRRPDQGLTDEPIRAAWTALLSPWLPATAGRILDVGSGTGSLSLLLAEAGHAVTGIDFSPAMVALARAKSDAAGVAATFMVADATAPDFPPASFDAIVCRQVLWALADREAALRNWAALLKNAGSLVLVEGRFASGNGMSADEIAAVFPSAMTDPAVSDLSGETALWGGPISDQRLLVTARRRPSAATGSAT